MASDEISTLDLTAFRATTLGCASANARYGALAYVFMDFRHIEELMRAGEIIFDGLTQLYVWNKIKGEQEAFYRSQHELVPTFKIGAAPHLNDFGLGESGRYRTNVWSYRGSASLKVEPRSPHFALTRCASDRRTLDVFERGQKPC